MAVCLLKMHVSILLDQAVTEDQLAERFDQITPQDADQIHAEPAGT